MYLKIKVLLLILRLISILGVVYIEYFRERPTDTVQTQTHINKFENFDNMYAIYFKKPFSKSELIGYKQERFTQIGENYKYKILMKIGFQKFKDLNNLINLKGEMNFDPEGVIENFDIIIQDNIIINGERQEQSSKMLIKVNNLSNPDPGLQEGKLIDINELNFDFFTIRTLPFKNLKINKIYEYKYFMPSSITSLENLKEIKVKVKKISEYEYKIQEKFGDSTIETITTFDENNNIIKEKNIIAETILVRDDKQKEKLVKEFGGENNTTTNLTKNIETNINTGANPLTEYQNLNNNTGTNESGTGTNPSNSFFDGFNIKKNINDLVNKNTGKRCKLLDK